MSFFRHGFSWAGKAPRQWLAVSALLLAGCGVAGTVWGQQAGQGVANQSPAAANPMYWLQRCHNAVTRHPYMGTVTVTQERGRSRSARVWHGVRDGQQPIDRIDMLLPDGNSRTLLHRGRDMVMLREEKDGQRHRAGREIPWGGGPFTMAEQMDHALLRQSVRYYRVVPLGQQRVASYQTDAIGFMPTDKLRASYRFWTEQQTGLLLKWQMLEMDAADAQAWDKAKVLREITFSDVQVPAPVDYAMLQGMLNERLAGQGKKQGRPVPPHRLSETSLQAQGWAWRQPLPGYVVKQCYWRKLDGMSRGAPRPHSAEAAQRSQRADVTGTAAQQLLHCLVTDGLSRFSVFIGPKIQSAQMGVQMPPSPAHGIRPPHPPREGGMRMARRQYADSHSITAVGAVPQLALQQAVDALYRP